MPDRDEFTNGDHFDTIRRGSNEKLTTDESVDVSDSPANRKQNPEIGSRGSGPVIINDEDATMLNQGIFDKTNREYYDPDLYR